MIDTHCHLDAEAFQDETGEIIQRAMDAGVRAMVTIGIDPQSWERSRKLSSANTSVVRAAGIHPTSVTRWWSREVQEALARELKGDGIVAVGESGLDFFRGSQNRLQQMEAFRTHLELSQEHQLPIVIHQRDALDDVLTLLDEVPPSGGVLHCFTGKPAEAEECIQRGLFLGIGGIVTFPSAKELQDAVRTVPLSQLILETDAPYLAPQGHRGKRNEPAYLPEVAEKIAELKQESVTSVIEQTTLNAIRLFGQQLADAVDSIDRTVACK